MAPTKERAAPADPQQFDPVSITVGGVDPDNLMLTGTDTRAEDWPIFSVGEVGKGFFGLSAHSVRAWERDGALGEVRRTELGGSIQIFASDGTEIGRRSEHDARTYSLGDIERMVHSLVSKRAISGEIAAWALVAVKARAEIARLRVEARAPKPASDLVAQRLDGLPAIRPDGRPDGG